MLQCNAPKSVSACPFGAPARCPHCGDWMVAPLASEFVEDAEIRHHWACENCAQPSTTTIPLCTP